ARADLERESAHPVAGATRGAARARPAHHEPGAHGSAARTRAALRRRPGRRRPGGPLGGRVSPRSIDAFLAETAQDDQARDPFQLENAYLLELNLDGRVWAKRGSMIGYTGSVRFSREGVLEHGVGRALRKAVTGE